MILDRPNHFGRVPIVLDGSNSFWLGPSHFGQVQITKISSEKSNLNLNKIIWIRPKLFGPNQNNLDPSKKNFTVQNHFGPGIIRPHGLTRGHVWIDLNLVKTNLPK